MKHYPTLSKTKGGGSSDAGADAPGTCIYGFQQPGKAGMLRGLRVQKKKKKRDWLNLHAYLTFKLHALLFLI